MKLFTLLTATTISALALANDTPPAVQKCTFHQCVLKYYMCNKGDKDCAPKLTSLQKYSWEAFNLCKRIKGASCTNPLPNSLVSQLQSTQQQFDTCKVSCYKQNAPKLYAAVFQGKK